MASLTTNQRNSSIEVPVIIGLAGSRAFRHHHLIKGLERRGHQVQVFEEASTKCTVVFSGHKSSQELDDFLFPPATCRIPVLKQNSIVIVALPLPYQFSQGLPSRLREHGRGDIHVVECLEPLPTDDQSESTKIFLIAGHEDGVSQAKPLLECVADTVLVVPGGLGSARKAQMVNQLLYCTQLVTAAEAIALADRIGLNSREVLDIVSQAAGSSWALKNRGPRMTSRSDSDSMTISSLLETLNELIDSARGSGFPLPMSLTAEQTCLLAATKGLSDHEDSSLVEVFSGLHKCPISSGVPDVLGISATPAATSLTTNKIAICGLGAMGMGMAVSLVRGGFSVHGYDVYKPSVEKFTSSGKASIGATSPADAAEDADILIIMVQNAAQAKDVLFGAGDAARRLARGATVILSSTVSPTIALELYSSLQILDRDLELLDAPVSGGATRAAQGDLMILCSGNDQVFPRVESVLGAMTGRPENISRIRGGVGAASSVKLVNQLLAGVHIATAAEAMAFAAHINLDTSYTFEMIRKTEGWSWMFENRVPQMLTADWTPFSAMGIFVKDLGIVLEETRRLSQYSPMASGAYALYLWGASRGWTRDADASIVRFWEEAGSTVASHTERQENL